MLRLPTTSEIAPAGRSEQPEMREYIAVGQRRRAVGMERSEAMRGKAMAIKPLERDEMNCVLERLR